MNPITYRVKSPQQHPVRNILWLILCLFCAATRVAALAVECLKDSPDGFAIALNIIWTITWLIWTISPIYKLASGSNAIIDYTFYLLSRTLVVTYFIENHRRNTEKTVYQLTASLPEEIKITPKIVKTESKSRFFFCQLEMFKAKMYYLACANVTLTNRKNPNGQLFPSAILGLETNEDEEIYKAINGEIMEDAVPDTIA